MPLHPSGALDHRRLPKKNQTPLTPPDYSKGLSYMEQDFLKSICFLLKSLSNEQKHFAAGLDRSQSPVNLILSVQGGLPSSTDLDTVQSFLTAVTHATSPSDIVRHIVETKEPRAFSKYRRRVANTSLNLLQYHLLRVHRCREPDDQEIDLKSAFTVFVVSTYPDTPTPKDILKLAMDFLQAYCTRENQPEPEVYWDRSVHLATLLLRSRFLQQAQLQEGAVGHAAWNYARNLKRLIERYHRFYLPIRRVWHFAKWFGRDHPVDDIFRFVGPPAEILDSEHTRF